MLLRSGKISASRNGVKDDLPVVEADVKGAATSVHAESENSMTSVKIATEVRRYPNVIDDEWLHIFAKLNPEAKATFSRVSDGWHDLVAWKRPEFLSKELAPIVATLPQRHFLKFRQLSRSWNTEVTHYLQDYPARFRFPFEISGGTKVKYIPAPMNHFKSAQAIQGFLKDMENHPDESPFPGGSVALEFEVPSRDDPRITQELPIEYWANVLQLLEKYGSHIYFLTFSHDVEEWDRPTSVGLATTFRQCLLLLPNLQRLSVRGGNKGVEWSASLHSVLKTYLQDNALPQLKFLEAFDAHDAHVVLINAVLHSCPVPGNMKRLWIEEIETDYIEFFEPSFTFINLEVLNTPLLYIQDLQRLSQQAIVPPIRELVCKIWDAQDDPIRVFRALEPFRNSLIQLDCKSFLKATEGEWSTSTFDLPNLRKLHLTFLKGPFDPIVHFKSLTDLRVDYFWALPSYMRALPAPQVNKDLKGGLTERLEILGFENKMYVSNIWRLIPFLEKLQIKGHKYERRIYDWICKARTSKSK